MGYQQSIQKSRPKLYQKLLFDVINDKIGTGIYGNVYKVKMELDGKNFALKKICLNDYNQQEIEQVEKIGKFLLEAHHPCIVKVYDVLRENNFLTILMDLCPYNLDDYLEKHQIIEKEVIIKIFLGMIDALHYMKKNFGCCHNDIT
jgi:serine/threonine protein kinase